MTEHERQLPGLELEQYPPHEGSQIEQIGALLAITVLNVPTGQALTHVIIPDVTFVNKNDPGSQREHVVEFTQAVHPLVQLLQLEELEL